MPERILSPKSSNRTFPCVICKKEVLPDSQYFPFCSKRCKTIDLGNWADESYVVSRAIEQSDLDEE